MGPTLYLHAVHDQTSAWSQVEADIRPFRGILLGLFFVTTGSSLDLALLFQQWPIVLALTGGLISVKVGIIGSVAPLFGLTRSPFSYNPCSHFLYFVLTAHFVFTSYLY
jgi:Kef-type K+ transport system membrane component KefB